MNLECQLSLFSIQKNGAQLLAWGSYCKYSNIKGVSIIDYIGKSSG